MTYRRENSGGTYKRWHRDASGVVRPCTATVKACPYGEHFDTQEDGQDKRQRRSHRAGPQDYVQFRQHVDRDLRETASRGESLQGADPNLRSMSDKAMALFQATGRRPQASFGEILITLPDGSELKIQRESYDRYELNSHPPRFQGLGFRYVVRHSYGGLTDVYMETLHNRHDYGKVQEALQKAFTSSRERLKLSTPLEEDQADREYRDLYQSLLHTVDEIEIMSQGAEKCYRSYGIDLFDASDPQELSLSATCSKSALQPYDIVDSLRVHAMYDSGCRNVALHVDESYPDAGAAWAIDRTAEGEWYFTVEAQGVTTSTQYTQADVEAMGQRVEEVLQQAGVPEAYRPSQVHFVKRLMAEVEPAIQNYQATRRHALEMRDRTEALPSPQEPPPPPQEEAQEKKRSPWFKRSGDIFSHLA